MDNIKANFSYSGFETRKWIAVDHNGPNTGPDIAAS